MKLHNLSYVTMIALFSRNCKYIYTCGGVSDGGSGGVDGAETFLRLKTSTIPTIMTKSSTPPPTIKSMFGAADVWSAGSSAAACLSELSPEESVEASVVVGKTSGW